MLFRKLEDGELSDKVFSWRAAIKQITWQLLSTFLFAFCSFIKLGGVKTLYLALLRLVSYCFIHISLHTGCLPWQKLMQKIAILARACRLIVASLPFVFVVHRVDVRRATYLGLLDCTKNVDKNWNVIVSFIIYGNFDHAWAEHYPVTLILTTSRSN